MRRILDVLAACYKGKALPTRICATLQHELSEFLPTRRLNAENDTSVTKAVGNECLLRR